MNIKKLCLLIIMSNMMACAEQATKSVELVPVEERNAPIAETKEKPKVVDTKKGKAIDQEKEPVITALLKDADQFSKQGETEKAASTIERALRIEPKNALLWHRLAVVRMQQEQWQQAIVMARKSNALAGNNKQLKSDNWGIIAAAYDSLGNKEKANEARNKQSGQA
jgi:tetratricopeptide (TPR) repeat protein